MARQAIKTEWTAADRAVLAELKKAEKALPENAPRALLSIRLSVLTADTTSPARQELDLRQLAREHGYRVVGVASDLNVSATEVPPWERKVLGEWLSNRAHEFDVLLFWKLDRLVRRVADLSTMIEWCARYEKNLVSKHDEIDLETPVGRKLVALITRVAEIEVANTSTRVTSLWEYTRKQDMWLVGKPPYGYVSNRVKGRSFLTIEPDAYKALHWARRMALRGASARRMTRCLARSGLMSAGLTPSTLLRRLRNPALMGVRVTEDKNGGIRRSTIVIARDGNPIQVAPPIFTPEEFETLQATLDARRRNQPTRQAGGATRFRGVLVCADCGTNLTVQCTRNKHGEYSYLRCQQCKSGGRGAPDPTGVYEQLAQEAMAVLGDLPVRVLEYAKAVESHGTTRGASGGTWLIVSHGETFRDAWAGNQGAIERDLKRAGVRCVVTRTHVKGVRAPSVHLQLEIPDDVRDRLVIKPDSFDCAPEP